MSLEGLTIGIKCADIDIGVLNIGVGALNMGTRELLFSIGVSANFHPGRPFPRAPSFPFRPQHPKPPRQHSCCLRRPNLGSAAPGWFVKVINEVVKGLERVAAYLDDIIVYDTDPTAHTANIRALFQCLRIPNLKLSAAKARIGATKARIGATKADFLGPTTSPAGFSPNADKVAALTKMPMPANVRQVRALIGRIGYYRESLGNLSTRLRPTTALLKQTAKFLFTPAMEATVREILRELAAFSTPVFPDYDAVADNSRPLRLYCDASRDGFGATLERKQLDGSVRPILFISRATLDSERSCPPGLDLEVGSIVSGIKRLRGHLWSTKFVIYSDHRALENITKVDKHIARVQSWLDFLSAYTYTLEYRKGTANGNADLLSRLPQPATDRTEPNRLSSPDTLGIYLIHPCGFTPCEPSMPGIGLGGLVPTSSLPIPVIRPSPSLTTITATSAALDPPSISPDLPRPPKLLSGLFRRTTTPPNPLPGPRTVPWTLALLLAWLSGRPSSLHRSPLAPQL